MYDKLPIDLVIHDIAVFEESLGGLYLLNCLWLGQSLEVSTLHKDFRET